MGSGVSRLLLPSCVKSTPENHPDLIFTTSEPLPETKGHLFCYVPSSDRFLSPSHSDRLISPSQSLRLSPSRTTKPSETAFKSISGASVGANTTTAKTVLQPDSIYNNATDNLFESTSSFRALPLQPIPRAGLGPSDSGPIESGFFMSGPISGPLDSGAGAGVDYRNHFSAPLGGMYQKRKKRKAFSGVRKAFSRSSSEKKRPWVVPVFNIAGQKDSSGGGLPEGLDFDGKTEGEFERNVQWAHGKAGEDRVHVVVSEDHGWLFVGIYDGFNGPDAPEFLMCNLYRAVFNELEGLFWESVNEEDCSVIRERADRDRNLECIVGVEEADPGIKIVDEDRVELPECQEDLNPSISTGTAKRVTFQSEQGGSQSQRRKTLWEFLAEGDDDDEGLDLSGSKRFAFSFDNAFRVNNPNSGLRRSSVLFSKLKQGFARHKEAHRKLFPWRYDWEDKQKIEVENKVEERLQRNPRKCKVGPVDHELVLRALSRALEATELAYLDMTDKFLDRNPELALMGSCLLAVLMRDEDVYVMNVGDSRAIVAQYQPLATDGCAERSGQGCRGSNVEGIVEDARQLGDGENQVAVETPTEVTKLTALQLSTDHSTSIEEEILRIKAEHPDDSQCIVNDRVKGRLKVTRAFGAGFLKQPKWNNVLLEMFRNEYIGTAPYLSCSPSLCHHKLGPNDQFLVLSSDGIYQYLTNQEVVSYVESFMEKFPDGDPAQHLIEELLFRAAKKAGMDFHELLDIPQGDRRKYHDDVTVMVVSLEGRIWKSSGKYW